MIMIIISHHNIGGAPRAPAIPWPLGAGIGHVVVPVVDVDGPAHPAAAVLLVAPGHLRDAGPV